MEFRIDIGQLRPPKRTADGRLVAEGLLTRAGVFSYRNPDGTERRELRLPDEVFRKDALDSFALTPVTNNHPPELINAKNAKRYSVGTVGENVQKDGDFVRARLVVHDAETIRQMEAGKASLSCGYEVELDKTPGVHPEYGRYDAIQRRIVGNHVAIVDTARAGEAARVRMDAAVMLDSDLGAEERNKLSDASFAVPSRRALPIENEAHVRAAMSRFGQTDFQSSDEKRTAYHKILARAKALGMDASGFEQAWSGRLDSARFDSGGQMAENTKEALDAAVAKLATEKARADAAEKARDEFKSAADEARGQVESLKEKVTALEKSRQDGSSLESEIRALKANLEAAEKARADAEDPDRLRKAVASRSKLETRAAIVLGGVARFDTLTDREIMVAVLERLGKSADLKEASDAYVKGRFDTAVEQYLDGERALDKLRSVTTSASPSVRIDTRSPREKMIARNRGLEPQEQE
jgi:hypothetical protein